MAAHDRIIIHVAPPMVETDIGDNEKIESSRGVTVVDEVDLMSRRGVTDMSERGGSASALFGAGKDGHDLVKSLIQATVSDVHGGIRTEELPDLSKTAGITVGVVSRHQVAN